MPTILSSVRKHWPFVIVPLVLLLLVVSFQWRALEHGIAANAEALLQPEHTWAKVENYQLGRNVLIDGVAPNKLAADAAVALAEQAAGVRQAQFVGSVLPSRDPATLTIDVRAERIKLRGQVNDRASADALIASAIRYFGSANTDYDLAINAGSSETPLMRELFAKLHGVRTVFTLVVDSDKMIVSGEMPDTTIQKVIIDGLRSSGFPGQVEDQTTKAPTVDKNICQDRLNQTLAKSKINFARGRSAIESSSHTQLQALAEIAVTCPSAVFEVGGHTDASGNANVNLNLSQERADQVVNFFVELGLDAERFEAVGYGANVPLGDNANAEGRAQNRRIEFKLKN